MFFLPSRRATCLCRYNSDTIKSGAGHHRTNMATVDELRANSLAPFLFISLFPLCFPYPSHTSLKRTAKQLSLDFMNQMDWRYNLRVQTVIILSGRQKEEGPACVLWLFFCVAYSMNHTITHSQDSIHCVIFKEILIITHCVSVFPSPSFMKHRYEVVYLHVPLNRFQPRGQNRRSA